MTVGASSSIGGAADGERLIVRSPPTLGESALGWALRLADLNGYSNHTVVTGSDEHSLRARKALCLSERHVAHLAVLTRSEERQLRLLGTVGIGKRKILYPGHQIALVSMVNRTHPRVCPICLKGSKILRAAWDLELWIGCPEHGCLMLDRCPGCGQALSWGRRYLDCCCENFPFSEAIPLALPLEVVDLMRALASALGESAPSPSTNMSALTEGMSLRDILTLIKHLGLLGQHSGKVPSHEFSRRLSFVAATAVVKEAACVLSDWPSAFHRLIEKIAEASTGEGRQVTFRAALRPMLLSFLTSLVGSRFEPFLRELATYSARSYGIRSAALCRRLPEPDGWLPLCKAARRVGMRDAELARRLAQGEVSGIEVTDPRGKRWLVPKIEVQRLESRRGCQNGREAALRERDLLTANEASILLGLTRKDFQALVEAELIQGGAHLGDVAGRGRTLLFARDGVHGLLTRIAGHTPSTAENLPSRRVGTLPGLTHPLQCDLVSLLRLVFHSDLAPVAINSAAHGIRRFLFSQDELEGAFRDVNYAKRWTVTEQTAMAKMGIPSTTLSVLVARGFIRARQPPGGPRPPRFNARPRRLCSASLEHFMAEHITAAMLTSAWKLTAAEATKLMVDAKALQVAPGCWRRIDVEGTAQALVCRRLGPENVPRPDDSSERVG